MEQPIIHKTVMLRRASLSSKPIIASEDKLCPGFIAMVQDQAF